MNEERNDVLPDSPIKKTGSTKKKVVKTALQKKKKSDSYANSALRTRALSHLLKLHAGTFYKREHLNISEKGKIQMDLSPICNHINIYLKNEEQGNLTLKEIQTAVYNVFRRSAPTVFNVKQKPVITVTKSDMVEYIESLKKLPLTRAEKQAYEVEENEVEIDLDLLEDF